MPVGNPVEEADELRGMLARIHSAARKAGRDPKAIGVDAQVFYNWVPTTNWVDYAAGWEALGATHLTVTTMGLPSPRLDDHLGALEQIRDDLERAGLLSDSSHNS